MYLTDPCWLTLALDSNSLIASQLPPRVANIRASNPSYWTKEYNTNYTVTLLELNNYTLHMHDGHTIVYYKLGK